MVIKLDFFGREIMITLMTDEELCNKIVEYDQLGDEETQCIYSSIPIEEEIKIIKVGIWESEMNQVDIVVTSIKNSDGACVLGNNKVFKVCSFDMETDDLQNIKCEGLRIKKMLTKNFRQKGIRIISELRYKE